MNKEFESQTKAIEKIKKIYLYNESINEHSQNFYYLAMLFGSDDEIQKTAEILKHNNKIGYASTEGLAYQRKYISKYYDQLFKEL